MIHVAFLTPEYPHSKALNAAGIGTSIKNLAHSLVKNGCKVTVFVYGQENQIVEAQEGITIHIIKAINYKIGKWFFYSKYLQNYINSIIKKENISLIEAPDWTGITAFMKFNIPLILKLHGSDAYFCHLEGRKQKVKNYWFEKIALQQADGYIAPTDFAAKVTSELFKIDSKKITTIPNGIEVNKFHNQFPNQFEKGVVLYIGTIIRKKGVFELPEIFSQVLKEHPDSKLVLIGNDSHDILTKSNSTWHKIKEKFENLGILNNVSYLGKIPYQEVQSYIEKAQVCIFPTFAETQGMVTIEAMAMNKPVVNSNFGWSKELIIDGESGFLVHPKNHQLYAQKINLLLADEALCYQIGANARKRVEEVFDIDKLAIRTIEYYKTNIK
ncbi:glycosyltransferase family 4 protein [Flavobacterium koreense]